MPYLSCRLLFIRKSRTYFSERNISPDVQGLWYLSVSTTDTILKVDVLSAFCNFQKGRKMFFIRGQLLRGFVIVIIVIKRSVLEIQAQ